MITKHVPSISFIIPTLNEADYIEKALRSIDIENSDIECLVVDGGSNDGTCAIVRQWPQIQIISADQSGRGYQMNLGARSATGDVFVFLHADCIMPENALVDLRKVLKSDQIVGGSFCLGFVRRHWLLQFSSFLSRINHPLTTYGDQAQFMRRDVFHNIQGFKEWPLMEDLEIQFRLKKKGRLVKIRRPVMSSDRRYQSPGPIFRQMLNVVLVGLFLVGVQPARLARWYKSGPPTK